MSGLKLLTSEISIKFHSNFVGKFCNISRIQCDLHYITQLGGAVLEALKIGANIPINTITSHG
jgi:hypothetical protein